VGDIHILECVRVDRDAPPPPCENTVINWAKDFFSPRGTVRPTARPAMSKEAEFNKARQLIIEVCEQLQDVADKSEIGAMLQTLGTGVSAGLLSPPPD